MVCVRVRKRTGEHPVEQLADLFVDAELSAVGPDLVLGAARHMLHAEGDGLGPEAGEEGRRRQLPVLDLGRVHLVGVPVEQEHERLVDKSLHNLPQVERSETVLAPVCRVRVSCVQS